MTLEEVKKLNREERLCYFVTERERVRIKKENKEPRPWTNDQILHTFRFCNVRRMDDKVSRWLFQRWYRPNFGHPNMVTAVTLARQLNNLESLHEVGFPVVWNPEKTYGLLKSRSSRGLKNFGAAYMITGTLGGTKIEQIVYKVVNPIYNNPPIIEIDSMEETWNNLLPYAGFSSFIAGQVVADLRWAVRGSWKDKNTWAPKGPGSRRGINILFDREIDRLMNQADFLEQLKEVVEIIRKGVPLSITSRLEMHDFQSCLCEYYKYSKTLLGLGKPKQIYRG